MRKQFWKMLCVCVAAFSLSACQMLPVEETLPPVPSIEEVEEEDYTYIQVQRGDMANMITIRCNYELTKEETLSFSAGGLLIESVAVSKGQQVKAGDLVASLEQQSLQQQLDAQRHQLNLLLIRQRQLKQAFELELDGYNSIYTQLEQERKGLLGTPDQTAQIQKLDGQMQTLQQYIAEAQSRYDGSAAELAQSLYVQKLQVTELENKWAQQQLFAGMDGVITYLLPVEEGMRSEKGRTFATITDLDCAAFVAPGTNAQYLPVGTQVEIDCAGKTYQAVVADPAEWNSEEADPEKIYLQLLQPDPSLKKNTSGTISITLEEKENVLYISKNAVKTIDGKPFVYVPDENGLRTMQYVTTGLQVDDVIEITSGLKEGDRVIVEAPKETIR